MMDIFAEYKPIRNRISSLSVEDALAVIWAYCQYLQIDQFQFPGNIEVAPGYLQAKVPEQWIAEWDLELLAKEVVINGGAIAKKGVTLRAWNTLTEMIASFRQLEGRIYKAYGSQEHILLELIRIAHRQFIWQSSSPNLATTIRYFKIFDRPGINEICCEKIGLNIWQTFMCGVTCMGSFLTRPSMAIPFKSEIKALPVDVIEKFIAFASKPIGELRQQLKAEQHFDVTFPYAYNSLRTYPLIRMNYQGKDSLVCPLMTLLFWKFTGGLYYELIGVPRFANEFGDGFQSYVGDVIDRACPAPMQYLGEQVYTVRKSEKRSVDWIVADPKSALFLECKAKRLSWGAKESLIDLRPLEDDIDAMASAVVQVYKTISDYLRNAYPHFEYEENRKVFPAIVTLENWRMFGPVMMTKLADAVTLKLKNAGLSPDVAEKMPYSIWAIEDLEVGLQIMSANGIANVVEGKVCNAEMHQWDWHTYLISQFPSSYPARKLFEGDYDQMMSPLFQAQYE